MDAAVPVDAKNARPPGTWKTVENAVSHSAHTHYCFRERMIENGESTSVAKPSTESDQAQEEEYPVKNTKRVRKGINPFSRPRRSGQSDLDEVLRSSEERLARPNNQRPSLLWSTTGRWKGPVLDELCIQPATRGSHNLAVVALQAPDDVSVILPFCVSKERDQSLVRHLRSGIRRTTARRQEAEIIPACGLVDVELQELKRHQEPIP